MRRRANAAWGTIQDRGDNSMEIKRSGSQPSAKGPAERFTGTVRIDPLFRANAPARGVGNAVTFEPGALDLVIRGEPAVVEQDPAQRRARVGDGVRVGCVIARVAESASAPATTATAAPSVPDAPGSAAGKARRYRLGARRVRVGRSGEHGRVTPRFVRERCTQRARRPGLYNEAASKGRGEEQ